MHEVTIVYVTEFKCKGSYPICQTTYTAPGSITTLPLIRDLLAQTVSRH